MKIDFYQMSKGERNIISDALRVKARNMDGGRSVLAHHYLYLSNRIRHGELLLGEYVYTVQEKGGDKQ